MIRMDDERRPVLLGIDIYTRYNGLMSQKMGTTIPAQILNKTFWISQSVYTLGKDMNIIILLQTIEKNLAKLGALRLSQVGKMLARETEVQSEVEPY